MSTTGRGQCGWYEIRIQGRLDDHWSTWLDDFEICHADDGTTVLRGQVGDQAALHGLLRKLRDLGLPLLSVTQPGTQTGTQTGSQTGTRTGTRTGPDSPSPPT